MTNYPTSDTQCYDNTKVSAYETCPRYYFIRHVLHWRSEGTGAALVFGLSWHDGQDIVWAHAKKYNPQELTFLAHEAFKNTWQANGFPVVPSLSDQVDQLRNPGIAGEMFSEYITARWRMLQTCEVEGIETPFAFPMPYLDDCWYIGRLDKVVKYNGQRVTLEHKTTALYATIGNFRQDYIDSWYMASQLMGYQVGATLHYGDTDAVWVDAALVHKKIHNAFKFIPVSFNEEILREWISSTAEWIRVIRDEERMFEGVKELTPRMFKKNLQSCYGKYGACPFIDICRTCADPSKLPGPPPGFVVERWEPFNVLGLNKIVETDNA